VYLCRFAVYFRGDFNFLTPRLGVDKKLVVMAVFYLLGWAGLGCVGESLQ
jgi:hypothetical protein